MTLTCQVCEKAFEVTPAWARGGRRKYCSRQCNWKASLAGKRVGAVQSPEARNRISEGRTGKGRGPTSHAWKGGRYHDQNGYVAVNVSTLTEAERAMALPMLTKGTQYVREHRLVAAMKIGRPLLPHEVVHHHNGVKDDNRPENLFVKDQASHSLEHRLIDRELARLRERVAELEAENAALRSRLT